MVQSPPSTVPTESISLSHTKKSARIFIKSSATNLLDIYSFPVMLADLQLKSNICIRNCQTSYYIFGIFQTKSVRPTSHVRASDWTVGLPTLLSTSTSCKKNFKLPLHHDTYWLIEHSFFAFIKNPLSSKQVSFVLCCLLRKI